MNVLRVTVRVNDDAPLIDLAVRNTGGDMSGWCTYEVTDVLTGDVWADDVRHFRPDGAAELAAQVLFVTKRPEGGPDVRL